MGGKEDLIFRVATFDYLKCPVLNKRLKAMQRKMTIWPLHRDMQLTETLPEEAHMLNLSDREFKSAIINIFKERN